VRFDTTKSHTTAHTTRLDSSESCPSCSAAKASPSNYSGARPDGRHGPFQPSGAHAVRKKYICAPLRVPPHRWCSLFFFLFSTRLLFWSIVVTVPRPDGSTKTSAGRRRLDNAPRSTSSFFFFFVFGNVGVHRGNVPAGQAGAAAIGGTAERARSRRTTARDSGAARVLPIPAISQPARSFSGIYHNSFDNFVDLLSLSAVHSILFQADAGVGRLFYYFDHGEPLIPLSRTPFGDINRL
jgi:hypothetical protein